jgi:hypothetical protein
MSPLKYLILLLICIGFQYIIHKYYCCIADTQLLSASPTHALKHGCTVKTVSLACWHKRMSLELTRGALCFFLCTRNCGPTRCIFGARGKGKGELEKGNRSTILLPRSWFRPSLAPPRYSPAMAGCSAPLSLDFAAAHSDPPVAASPVVATANPSASVVRNLFVAPRSVTGSAALAPAH